MVIQYKRAEWTLWLPNLVRHGFGLSFIVERSGEDYSARLIEVEEPDKVLEDDAVALTKVAVTAYLDLIGSQEPGRPGSNAKGRSLKPN